MIFYPAGKGIHLTKTITWESLLALYALRSGLAITIVIAVAVGCAGVPGFGESADGPAQTTALTPNAANYLGGTHPIAAFLAAARAGDSTFLTLPETGKRAQVTAHRMYFAASGRYCRRYDVASSNSATTVSYGLACRNDQGEWTLEQLLVNPNDVNGPQQSPVAPAGNP
jgi:hypothetical protein